MVPFHTRNRYQPMAMTMMLAHHFQSHNQRGPLDISFASRSFMASLAPHTVSAMSAEVQDG